MIISAGDGCIFICHQSTLYHACTNTRLELALDPKQCDACTEVGVLGPEEEKVKGRWDRVEGGRHRGNQGQKAENKE